MRQLNHEFAPQGEGNVVSLEFNLMYRWHATTSQADTKWLEEIFGAMFDGKDSRNVCVLLLDLICLRTLYAFGGMLSRVHRWGAGYVS